jgi:hypothetical protein
VGLRPSGRRTKANQRRGALSRGER